MTSPNDNTPLPPALRSALRCLRAASGPGVDAETFAALIRAARRYLAALVEANGERFA